MNKSKNIRIFIAGPITGVPNYVKNFAIAEEKLKAKGFIVINPTKVINQLPKLQQHEYMSICIPMLKMCGYIYILNGSKKSKSTNQSVDFALKHNIKRIYQSLEESQ